MSERMEAFYQLAVKLRSLNREDLLSELVSNQLLEYDVSYFPLLNKEFPEFIDVLNQFLEPYLRSIGTERNIQLQYTFETVFTRMADILRKKIGSSERLGLVPATSLTFSMLFSPQRLLIELPKDPIAKYLQALLCLFDCEEAIIEDKRANKIVL